MQHTLNPATIYLSGLSEGTSGMKQCLDVIAQILDCETTAEAFPWWEVTYRESMAVRVALAERYQPGTVNKMLSGLRGVLKQAWRLGYVDVDTYKRAAAVENMRVSNVLSGRALAVEEIGKMFNTLTACQRLSQKAVMWLSAAIYHRRARARTRMW